MEIATRNLSDKDQIANLFLIGIEQFPQAHEIRIFYAISLLDSSDHLQNIPIHLAKASNFNPPIDIRYLAYTVEKIRQVSQVLFFEFAFL